MSDVAEGFGAAIEGALAGRAVEPGHGRNGAGDDGPASCANCGAEITSSFCPECGQKRHVHRTLSAIGHDLVHGVLHLDGKFWNTLPLLAFKPGKLTRRYIDGERAKFVSPMAMFLFTVFAMFAVFQMVGIGSPTEIANDLFGSEQDRPVEIDIRNQINTLEKEKLSLPTKAPRRDEIDGELKELNFDLAMIQSESGGSERAVNVHTGIEWLDKGLIGKWQKNPSLMVYKLQSNAYKFSWLLIPLSIPFVWLTFAWRRRFRAYDHAVFVTYSLSFMSLLFIAISLLGLIPGGSGFAALLFAIGAPLHIYKHLRHSYGLSRFSTLWRFLALLIFINIVIVLFLQALLLLGAF